MGTLESDILKKKLVAWMEDGEFSRQCDGKASK
jgi:hypothetical protein